MNISINALGTIVTTRIDNEAVVRVYISTEVSLLEHFTGIRRLPCFVSCMVARAHAPGRNASSTPTVAVTVMVVEVLGTRRKVEVHQMGDGRLSLPVAVWTHRELACQH